MWFINGKMLSVMIIAVAAYVIGIFVSDKLNKKQIFLNASVLISLAVVFCYSKRLCAFYILYCLLSYPVISCMPKTKFRRAYFVCGCFVLVAPFFVYRILDMTTDISEFILLVGFAYNMLKAVDALFYRYYTELKVPFFKYVNFIMFFPVFTSGPIFRYRDFSRTWDGAKPADIQGVAEGIQRFILGMFKKIVLVELCAKAFNKLVALPQYHFYISIPILVLAYLILYLDLSGYSDMAVGVGKIMSINVPENFNKPWTAASFTQFWRKWHITLSDWIREHIFVVVQGKKLSKYQSAIIAFCTMIIMSLWHEFSVMTIIGGAFIGFFLVIENIFSLSTFNVRKEKKYKYIIRCTAVSFLFAVNALSFSLDLGQIIAVLKGLVN